MQQRWGSLVHDQGFPRRKQVTEMPHRNIMTRRGFAFTGIALIATSAGVPLASRAQLAGEDASPEASPGASPAASPQATPEAGAEVTVGFTPDLRFDPEELVIHVGTTVRWINDSPMPHTATGDPEQNPVNESNPEYVTLPDGAEPWGSELLQPGGEYSHTFDVPGVYDYICIPHVMAGMRGTITVEDVPRAQRI
jgi:plastocyanin